MRKTLFVTFIVSSLFCTGCLSGSYTDPNSGKVITTVRLDPNNIIVKNIDTGLAVGQTISTASGTFWPIGTLIAGIFGAALVAWRKYQPLLTTAQTQASQAYNATSSVVTAIDKYKETYPANWAALKAELEKAVGPTAENIIRAIRGLPEKL